MPRSFFTVLVPQLDEGKRVIKMLSLTRLRTLIKSLGMTLVAASTFFVPQALSTTPEIAATPAYLTKVQYLTKYVDPGMYAQIERRIWISAGNYERVLLIDDDLDAPFKDRIYGKMYLGTGWYTWRQSIRGTNTWAVYLGTSVLDPDNPDWTTSTWQFNHDLSPCTLCDADLHLYEWGGWLRPLDW